MLLFSWGSWKIHTKYIVQVFLDLILDGNNIDLSNTGIIVSFEEYSEKVRPVHWFLNTSVQDCSGT